MDWKRCMLLLLMCFVAVSLEEVDVNIFFQGGQWLQCNWANKSNIASNWTFSKYLCTASSQSTSMNCSSQSGTTQASIQSTSQKMNVSSQSGTTQASIQSTSQKMNVSSQSGTTQASIQSTSQKMNVSSQSGTTQEECKQGCAGGIIAAAVIVSFLFGAITGVSVLFLVYIHRTKQFCFQTSDQTESVVSQKAKTDIKFMAQKVMSKRCAKSENGAESGPVIGKISTEGCQYEDLSSDVKEARTYDVLKHETVAEVCHGVSGDTSTDPKHLNVNIYDKLRESNVSHVYFVLEDQNFGNSHSITKAGKPTSYETVGTGNLTSGFPISTTKFKPRNGSTQEMYISGDKPADESKSHEYFILEATPDAKCTKNNMDLCSRRETSYKPGHESYPLDFPTKAQNLMSELKEPDSHGPLCQVYHILEAQKNQRDEAVSSTERNNCTDMNNQPVENPINHDYFILQSTENTIYEAKEKLHESCTPYDSSIEQPNHEYFVLEPQERQ